MMSLSENKQLAGRFMTEIVNQENLAAMDELLDDDAKAPLQEALTTLLILSAFPDARVNVERMIEESGKVTVVSTMDGTHTNAFLGIPPTRKGIQVRRIDVLTIERGKITGVLHNFDLISLLPQIGAFPSRATAIS